MPDEIITEAALMREARERLAAEVEAKTTAKAAAAKEAIERQQHPVDDFDRRLAAARRAALPAEPVAYRFVPRQGGFKITAITEADFPFPVKPKV
jgi:predicted DNA-binding protein